MLSLGYCPQVWCLCTCLAVPPTSATHMRPHPSQLPRGALQPFWLAAVSSSNLNGSATQDTSYPLADMAVVSRCVHCQHSALVTQAPCPLPPTHMGEAQPPQQAPAAPQTPTTCIVTQRHNRQPTLLLLLLLHKPRDQPSSSSALTQLPTHSCLQWLQHHQLLQQAPQPL